MANQKPTRLSYDIYKAERQKIVKRMERQTGNILNVQSELSFDEYKNRFEGLVNDDLVGDMNPRQIAKEIAKAQTYYATNSQAKAIAQAYKGMQIERGVPVDEVKVVEEWEFLMGTDRAREIFEGSTWDDVKDLYHKLVDEGMGSNEASNYIRQNIFGSP